MMLGGRGDSVPMEAEFQNGPQSSMNHDGVREDLRTGSMGQSGPSISKKKGLAAGRAGDVKSL